MRQTWSLDSFLETQGCLLLDGGLATELEASGHDLNDPLWSARLLTTDPSAIRKVHQAYLEAGADCIITASYQAGVPGLLAQGFSATEAESIIVRSVTLACEARGEFLNTSGNDRTRSNRPLVAASVGPYGAARADGSEYRGDYELSEDELYAFHVRRWEILAESAADLLACETIPSFSEARVLQRLLKETPAVRAWMSFSCRDGEHISDGTRLDKCVALFEESEQVVAVGINCTAPRHIPSLIGQVRLGAPTTPIVVYPNSGEVYDGKSRRWTGESDPSDFGKAALEWLHCGATLIGGCCRTGPQHIRAIKVALIQRMGEISDI